MKIIFSQGNPGSEYKDTRHNVGFRMLDIYSATNQIDWTEKAKFHAYMGEFSSAGEKVLLVKPTTYYNDTGITAGALIDFYKLESTDVLVLHDDMALPLGTIRTREKGSDAGNNGVKSLNSHIGPEYKRIRIGIWTELAVRMEATAFVLGKFTSDEQKILTALQPTVVTIIDNFLRGNFETTSYK